MTEEEKKKKAEDETVTMKKEDLATLAETLQLLNNTLVSLREFINLKLQPHKKEEKPSYVT